MAMQKLLIGNYAKNIDFQLCFKHCFALQGLGRAACAPMRVFGDGTTVYPFHTGHYLALIPLKLKAETLYMPEGVTDAQHYAISVSLPWVPGVRGVL